MGAQRKRSDGVEWRFRTEDARTKLDDSIQQDRSGRALDKLAEAWLFVLIMLVEEEEDR